LKGNISNFVRYDILSTINPVHVVKLHGDAGAGAARGFDMGL